MSSIRSASSRIRTLIPERSAFFLWRWSMNRPGVATMIS
jgi:hypothetical protein